MKHLEKLDIYHLQLFLALYKTPNTVKVANRLNISQSSVSRGLSKLRFAFKDQLFIRGQHGLQPTHIAIDLAKRLPNSLEALIEAVEPNNPFNPKTLDERVSIAMHPVLLQLLANSIYREFKKQAPLAELRIENWEKGSSQKLLDDEILIGLNYPIEMATKAIYCRQIYRDKICFMIREDHPLHGKKVEWSELNKFDFIGAIVPEFNDNLAMRHQIERLVKLQFNMPFSCPDLHTLTQLTLTSDAIFGGLKLYSANERNRLAYIDIDIPIEEVVPVNVYGNQKVKKSPKFQWVESLLTTVIKTITD